MLPLSNCHGGQYNSEHSPYGYLLREAFVGEIRSSVELELARRNYRKLLIKYPMVD